MDCHLRQQVIESARARAIATAIGWPGSVRSCQLRGQGDCGACRLVPFLHDCQWLESMKGCCSDHGRVQLALAASMTKRLWAGTGDLLNCSGSHESYHGLHDTKVADLGTLAEVRCTVAVGSMEAGMADSRDDTVIGWGNTHVVGI